MIKDYIFVFFLSLYITLYHFISLFGIIKSAIMNFDLLFQHEIKKNYLSFIWGITLQISIEIF